MSSRLARELAEAERDALLLSKGASAHTVASGVLRRVLLLLLVVALLVLFHYAPSGELLGDLGRFRAFIDGFGIRAELSFALLTAALMTIGSPRLFFYGLGGLLFGFWEGLAAALAGSLVGSVVVFKVARWSGRDWVRSRFGEHRLFRRLGDIRPTATAVAVARLLPLSNLLINVGLAFSRVRGRAFVLGTLVGFLPQGVIACLIGSGLAEGDQWAGVTQVIVALCLATGLGVWVARWRTLRRGRELVAPGIEQSESR